jgi:hypothetical protein
MQGEQATHISKVIASSAKHPIDNLFINITPHRHEFGVLRRQCGIRIPAAAPDIMRDLRFSPRRK